jgi:S-adenosylmethionine synthetase
VSVSIGSQSPDIAQGVDDAYDNVLKDRSTRWTARAPVTRA